MRSTRGLGGTVSVVAVASVLVGCLFPSFERFDEAKSDAGSGPKKDGSPADEVSASDAGGTIEGSSSGAPDASGETLPKVIQCGSKTCPVGSQFCCLGIAGDDCMDKSKADDCFFATRAHCDGNEDCLPGESCCAEPANPDVTCRSSCSGPGLVICTGARQCPAGKTCSRSLPDGLTACQ